MVVLKKIVVIGGGLTGLSAANMLRKLAAREGVFDSKLQVTLVESSNSFGGHLKSKLLPDGSHFMTGSRTVRVEPEIGEQIIKLVTDVGLEDNVIVQAKHKTDKNSKNLHGDIFFNGKFFKQRASFSNLFFNNGPLSESHFKIFLRERFTSKKDPNTPEESVHEFFTRRFGLEVSNILMSATCRSNFFTDCQELGMNSVFPQLVRTEQEFGSLTKSGVKSFLINSSPQFLCDLVKQSFDQQWDTWTLKNGMDSLPSAIEKNLEQKTENFEIMLFKNTVVNDISFLPSSRAGKTSAKVHIETNGKPSTMDADYVINCLPSDTSAKIFPKSLTSLNDCLNSIKKKNLIFVQMSFNPDYSNPLSKFNSLGISVPKNQDVPFLKLSLDSCLTPYKGNSLAITTTFNQSILDGIQSTEDINAKVLSKTLGYLRKMFGQNIPVPRSNHIEIKTNYWPIYDIKHHNKVVQCRQNLFNPTNGVKLPVSLAGISYDGLTTSKRVVSGNNAAEEALNYLL